MAAGQLNEVIGRLRDIVGSHGNSAVDAELLRRFVQDKDHAAFEGLVRRHGPMVLGVCRRVLRCKHDAEDAFQATFLVLLRKAASLRSPSKIGNWLYGVAYHTAVQARDAATKRRLKEAAVTRQAEKPENVWTTDLLPVVDKELERLPEKYRLPVVLCDLEGRTRKVVARELGLPEGTVASRLARGRTLLAKRLTRHGIMTTGGAVGTVLSESALSACVPTSLVVSVAHAAVLVASGHVADGGLSANIISLAKGALRTMLLRKLAKPIAVLLISAIVATGTGLMLAPSLASGTDDMHRAATAETTTETTVTVGVSYLQSVFFTNDAAADVKYTGKVIRVTGKMARIKGATILKSRGGYMHAYLMTLESANNTLLPVVFEFDADRRDQLAGLKTGQDLIIEGKCAGRNDDPRYKEGIVRFRDCKIIPTAK